MRWLQQRLEFLIVHKCLRGLFHLVGLEKRYKNTQPNAEHSSTLAMTEPFCAVSMTGALGMGVVNAVIFPGLVATRAV